MADPTKVRQLVEYWISTGTASNPGRNLYTSEVGQTAAALLDVSGDNLVAAKQLAPTYQSATSVISGSGSYSRLGSPSDYGSAVVGNGSTSTSASGEAALGPVIDAQIDAAGLTNLGWGGGVIQVVDREGKIGKFRYDNQGNIDFTQPITAAASLTEEQMLDNEYRRLQIAKLAGDLGGGGGGGGGRTVFPWEQQGAELDNQMKQLQLGAMQNPGSRFTNVNGYMVDSLTGNLVDPSELGLGRYNAETGRFNADTSRMGAQTERDLANFTMGPKFDLDKLSTEGDLRLKAAQEQGVLGNLGLDRSKFVADILRNPADGLARIYSQRGGISPLQQISMADILNSFNQQTKSISDATSRLGGGAIGGFPKVTPVPAKPPVPPVAQANQFPDFNSTNPEEPGGFTNPASDTYENDDWYAPGQEQQDLMTRDETPGGSYGIQEALEELQREADSRMAKGGYTRESRFIVGDQRSGRPTGHEELVVNPTNAPIAVVPNKMLKVSRFDEGTASAGPRKTINVKPTGGFLNSLRESFGGLEDTVNNSARVANSRFQADFEEDPSQFAMAAAPLGNPMSMAQKLKMAKDNGYSTAHFDPTDVLQETRNAAKEAWTTAASAYNKITKSGNFGEERSKAFQAMNKARQEFQKLDDEWGKVQDSRFKKSNVDARQSLMQEYDDAFAEVKSVRKVADDYIKNESGGQFESADDALRALSEMSPDDADRYLAMRKLVLHPSVRAYEAANWKLNDIAHNLTSFGRNPTEGVDDISRYADGTLFGGAVPDYMMGMGGSTNQQELIDMSRMAAGPGGNAVLGGSTPSPFRIPGLPTPTARGFNSLSGAEREALRPRLAAEFNSTLEDLMFDIEKRFGTSQSRMARFRG